MKLRFVKNISDAKMPTRAHETDAGWDLYATSTRFWEGPVVTYNTGIAVEIPPGYVGLVCERSSVKNKTLALCGGVIDSGYTGNIHVMFRDTTISQNEHQVCYKPGDKIAQLLIIPILQIDGWEEVDSLAETPRLDKGFGSSGN